LTHPLLARMTCPQRYDDKVFSVIRRLSYNDGMFDIEHSFRVQRVNKGSRFGRRFLPITVLIAEDKAVTRDAIRRVLALESEIKIAGEAEDFNQTLRMAADLNPQVILMDINMPFRTDLTAFEMRNIVAKNGSRLLAMSFSIDDETKELAKTFGAQRLLDKMRLFDQLIPGIREALTP